MASDWANLPKHILDVVSKRISSRTHFIWFSVVCKSWHEVAKYNERQYHEMSSCHHPPMLLILTGKKGTWNVYNPMDDKILNLQLSLPNKRFCGSSKGWLVAMNRDLAITLINPFFRVKGRKKREDSIINLPPLDSQGWLHELVRSRYVIKATMSTDPISNANDCVVVVTYGTRCKLAFIRLRKEKIWNYVDDKLDGIKDTFCFIEDVVYVKDKFYVAREGGILFSLDISMDHSFSIEQLVVHDIKSEEIEKTYLVVLNDDKELWMVIRYIDFRNSSGDRVTKEVKIFQLDFDTHKWIEKTTLNGVTLFLGDNFPISVVSSEFLGCRPNCIYFNYDHDRIVGYRKKKLCHDYGVYDVENKKFSQPFIPHAKTFVENTVQPPYWVVPPFQL